MHEQVRRGELPQDTLPTWTGTRRGFLQKTTQLAALGMSTPPILGMSFDSMAARVGQANTFYDSFRHTEASRAVEQYIGGRERATVKTHPEVFDVERIELGDLPQDLTGESISNGVLPSDGKTFYVLELEGIEDPLLSSPYFSVTYDNTEYQVGIAQGPDSKVAQLAVGFLPEGDHQITVSHTQFSKALEQSDPQVHILEVQANHPLMRDFVFPSLPNIIDRKYSDSPQGLGFREDTSVGLDLHLFMGQESCVQLLNNWRFKERVGDPHILVSGREEKDLYAGPYDLDAVQVGKARIADASCEELGYQEDFHVFGRKILSHQINIDKRFHPPQQLQNMAHFDNYIQVIGDHGMGKRAKGGNVVSRNMPEFSNYSWRGKEWERAVTVTSYRQLLLAGALDVEDDIVTAFIKDELDGNAELLQNPQYWSR